MSLDPGVTAEMGPAAVIKPQRQGGNAVARSHRVAPLSRRARRKSDRQNARERYIGEVVAGPLDWSPPSHPVLFPRVGAPSLTTSECVPHAVE